MKYKNGKDFVTALVADYCPQPYISPTISIQTYAKRAYSLFLEGVEHQKSGSDWWPQAYIALMRFCKLVLALKTHPSFKSAEYTRDRELNDRRLRNTLLQLEKLKPKLIERYDLELEREKEAIAAGVSATASTTVGDGISGADSSLSSTMTGVMGSSGLPGEMEEKALPDSSTVPSSASSSKTDMSSAERWSILKPPPPSETTYHTGPGTTTTITGSTRSSSAPSSSSSTTTTTGVTADLSALALSETGAVSSTVGGMDSIFSKPTLQPIIVPNSLVPQFIKVAKSNTARDIETCGVLCGKYNGSKQDSYTITHVIIPKQLGSSNTVEMVNEEELIGICEEKQVITLGWIHTHPSQTCFLSSVDLHCQVSYQIMMPNAIAIVHAPTDKTETFTLTPDGVAALMKCAGTGFHRHSERGLYKVADHVTFSRRAKVTFMDLRGR